MQMRYNECQNFKTKRDNAEYDPHLERHVDHPISNLETFINLIKCAIGTGCLAMPMAFKNAGWLNGIISTIVISCVVVYALHILLNNIYFLCKRHHVANLSYTEALILAMRNGPNVLQNYASSAGYSADFFLGLYHFAASSVYIVFVAENIKQILDFYGYNFSLRIHMWFYLPILIGLSLIRDLKHLVPFAALANVFFMTGVTGILYYVLLDLPPLEERAKYKSAIEYPMFFGVVLFSIESVGMIVSIEAQMKHPKSYLGWCGILNRGMLFVVILYVGFGFMGYWSFGENTANSVTLNIPEGEFLAQVVKFLFAAAILLSYPLQVLVSKNILWDGYMDEKLVHTSKPQAERCVRVMLVIASIICAVGFPFLGLLLSLAGSLCLSVLGLIFPAVMDICVRMEIGFGPLDIYMFQDIFLIIFGLVGGFLGTYLSSHKIMLEYGA